MRNLRGQYLVTASQSNANGEKLRDSRLLVVPAADTIRKD